MALETVVNIADLAKTNPTAADPKSQGDDHLRNIKTALLNDFAGFTGAVCVTGVDGGVVNAYTLTPANPLPAYSTRTVVVFSPTINNTGACTLNISGLGARSLKSVLGGALTLGDLIVGQVYLAVDNGTELRLAAMTKNYIDQLVISGSVPGVNTPANAGKFFTTDGTTGSWGTPDLNPLFVDKGDSGTAAQALNYSLGQNQRVRATGAFALSITNWPASGKLGAMLIELVNGAAFGITWPAGNWVKADGSFAATPAASGVTFQAAGTDFVLAWTRNGGATVYFKVVR